MATVNIGSLKFNWKGAYNGSTAYAVDDVTEYNGSSYICILASTGNLPTNTTYFQPMATKGTDGTDVGTTLTTQGDILYRDGSGLARLGAGTSGQFLKTLGTGANPAWADLSAGIKQIKLNTSGVTQYTVASSSYGDFGSEYQVSITPTSASNRILIYTQFVAQASGGRSYYTINKSGDSSGNGDLHTNVHASAGALANSENIGSIGDGYITFVHIDNSIASTNALTYKLRGKHSSGNNNHVGVADSANFMMAIELDGGLF